jgi:hypothetical protein
MGTLFELRKKKVFTVEEARQLLPLIRRLTEEASAEVKKLVAVIDVIRETNPSRSEQLEGRASQVISNWQDKIEKLGAEGRGVWLVDFDCGNGYYCWKYPEEDVEHFHRYTEGYQARVKIPADFTSSTGPLFEH